MPMNQKLYVRTTGNGTYGLTKRCSPLFPVRAAVCDRENILKMTLLSRIAVFMVFGLGAGVANASDWQYFGANIVSKQQVLQFFDAESVSRPSKDLTRVWTKAMRMKDYDRYFLSHKQEVIQKAGKKIATGYSSSYLLLPEVGKQFADATARKDAVIDLIVYEVVANA